MGQGGVFGEVGLRIGNMDLWRDTGDADKAMGGGGEEMGHGGSGSLSVCIRAGEAPSVIDFVCKGKRARCHLPRFALRAYKGGEGK